MTMLKKYREHVARSWIMEEKEECAPSSFQCPQCELIFDCLLSLDNHLKFHTNENPHECKKCHWSFYHKRDLTKHLNNSDCNSSSVSGKTVPKFNGGKNVNSEFMCDLCDKAFVSAYGLVRHKRLHTGERPFSCLECDKTFVDSGDLSKHMKVHSGETSLQCKVCDKICISEERLEAHMFKHNGKKRYECSHCHKVCKCKSHLDEHLRTHSREKPFKCSFCEVTYRYKSQLKDHTMAKHSEDGVKVSYKNSGETIVSSQIECDVCGALLSRQSLRHHKLLHKEKRHKCNHCNKAFISKYRLDVHSRSHTGERPFVCQLAGCGKAMTTKDGLMRHMVIHEGKKNHTCPYCGRQFYYTSNLNQHIRTHGGLESKRYTCMECNRSFSRKSILRKHQLNPCRGFILNNSKSDNNGQRPESLYYIPRSGISVDSHITKDIDNMASKEIIEDNLTAIIIDERIKELINPDDTLENPPSGFNMPVPALTSESQPIVYLDAVKSSWVSSQYKELPETCEQFQDVSTEVQCSYTNNFQKQNQQFILEPNSNFTSELEWQQKGKDKVIIQINDDKYTKNQADPNCLPAVIATVNAEVQTDNTWEHEESQESLNESPINETTWQITSPNEPWVETTALVQQTDSSSVTTFVTEDNSVLEVQPQQIVLSEDDLSNLMTLAGVSSDSEPHLSQVDDIVFVTFGQETVKIHTNKSLSEQNKEDREDGDTKDNSTHMVVPAKIFANNSVDFPTVADEKDFQFPVVTFKCLHCPEIFKYQYAIEDHCLSIHPGEDIYKCYDCEETFDSNKTLTRHSKLHDGNSQMQCNVCNKMFTHPTKLSNHMVRHTGVKPRRFKCDHCDRRFFDSTHLRDHVMVHSGEKPYICEDCGNKFVRKRDLEIHLRIHTGELPFKCPKCSKSFRAEMYLRNHLLVHNDAKPFQCTECDKGYITRAKLTLHMMNHTGNKPWKCDVPDCGKAYSDKRDFRHHQMRHSGEKPHKCSVCSKGFVLRGNLFQHQRIHAKK